MKNPFATTPHRVTHRVNQSPSVRNIPSTKVVKPKVNRPAPLSGLGGGCPGGCR